LNPPIKTQLFELDYVYLGCEVDKLQIISKLISKSVWNLILFATETQREMIITQKQELNKY
jgi:hypothetical protein